MSSGFVSGGTNEEPIQRDDEWLQAQQEIEANARRKQEAAQQDGGKSLYEVLQQNKVAKQEAFEESIRLKNQFRSLDDDEVDFLDSVLESTRAKEEEVKRETSEQLEIFRKQREAAERAALEDAGGTGVDTKGSDDADTWLTSSKKRRRGKDKDVQISKIRRTSSLGEKDNGQDTRESIDKSAHTKNVTDTAGVVEGRDGATHSATAIPARSNASVSKADVPANKPASSLGLAAYSSDED